MRTNKITWDIQCIIETEVLLVQTNYLFDSSVWSIDWCLWKKSESAPKDNNWDFRDFPFSIWDFPITNLLLKINLNCPYD